MWLGQGRLVFSAGNIIQPAPRFTWKKETLGWITRDVLKVPLYDLYCIRFNRNKNTNESPSIEVQVGSLVLSAVHYLAGQNLGK